MERSDSGITSVDESNVTLRRGGGTPIEMARVCKDGGEESGGGGW